ncbi:unnamed protein product [Caenorhabditis sp. 36 PRJEB53466]|nr:unnamed protein product [Caenorhabditis sp. 36 PRJEB53466]
MLIIAGIELMYLLNIYVVEQKVFDAKRWSLSEQSKKQPDLDHVTMMMLGKLAGGWTKVYSGKMTDEELRRQKTELLAMGSNSP